MPFDANNFIDETRSEIARLRKQARWSKRVGFIVLVVGLVLFICAGMQMFLLHAWIHRNESEFAFKIGKVAGTVWVWFDTNLTMLWRFVASLPFPKDLPGENYYLPWVTFGAFYLLILLSSFALKTRAIRLKNTADEAERTLNLQEPLLLQMNAFAAAVANQNVNVSGVSGSGNTINASATNSITNILHRANEKEWWERPGGLIVIAVITAGINKLLHFS